MCLIVLVVVGVGYSQISSTLCEGLEAALDRVEAKMKTCVDDCEVWWDYQAQLICDLDWCWGVVEGEGACPAGI